MNFWVDQPSRLYLLSGLLGYRIQFAIALGLVVWGVAQSASLQGPAYLVYTVLLGWLVWVAWAESVQVVMERDYRMVTVYRRRFLGFVSFSRAHFSYDDVAAVPVVSRHRYRQFGGETMWTVHLQLADEPLMPIGTIVDNARKIEQLLWLLRSFMGPRIADQSVLAAVELRERPRTLWEQLQDSDGVVRAGQIGCLVMIGASLMATPGMAWFYVFVLVFGTFIDWLVRRSDM